MGSASAAQRHPLPRRPERHGGEGLLLTPGRPRRHGPLRRSLASLQRPRRHPHPDLQQGKAAPVLAERTATRCMVSNVDHRGGPQRSGRPIIFWGSPPQCPRATALRPQCSPPGPTLAGRRQPTPMRRHVLQPRRQRHRVAHHASVGRRDHGPGALVGDVNAQPIKRSLQVASALLRTLWPSNLSLSEPYLRLPPVEP